MAKKVKMFTKSDALVQIFADRVLDGALKIADIPTKRNLRKAVIELLEELGAIVETGTETEEDQE